MNARKWPICTLTALAGLALPLVVGTLEANEDDLRRVGAGFIYDDDAPGRPLIGVTFAVVGIKITDKDMQTLRGTSGLKLLSLINTSVTDAGLKEVASFAEMQSLEHVMPPSGTTDAGVKALATLPRLRRLDLNHTKVTNACLTDLVRLKDSLRDLRLAYTKVTGSGLKTLKELRGLEVLTLQGTSLRDTDIKELAGLSQLRDLSLGAGLGGEGLTDASLKHLQGLPKLTALHLDFNKRITDAGMTELAALTGLTQLTLGFTAITDAGLAELGALRSLVRLELYGTKVTKKGVTELQKALPNCFVAVGG